MSKKIGLKNSKNGLKLKLKLKLNYFLHADKMRKRYVLLKLAPKNTLKYACTMLLKVS